MPRARLACIYLRFLRTSRMYCILLCNPHVSFQNGKWEQFCFYAQILVKNLDTIHLFLQKKANILKYLYKTQTVYTVCFHHQCWYSTQPYFPDCKIIYEWWALTTKHSWKKIKSVELWVVITMNSWMSGCSPPPISYYSHIHPEGALTQHLVIDRSEWTMAEDHNSNVLVTGFCSFSNNFNYIVKIKLYYIPLHYVQMISEICSFLPTND